MRADSMRPSRFWILFGCCAAGWLISSLLIAPSISGPDVFIFRDAGWNLAAWGSFESAAGPYTHDLVPRFYAYYTPIVPLLFGAYAWVFPRNAYAGTFFNLLLGLLAAAITLRWVLLLPASRLRNIAAWTVAVLAPVFVISDRPEVVALILFSTTIALTVKTGPRPALAGMLLAITFLAHPFAAIIACVWTFALWRSYQWALPGWPLRILKQVSVAAVVVAGLLGAVALLYYSIDRHSLARFAANALGEDSGPGVTLHMKSVVEFLETVRDTIIEIPAIWRFEYLCTLLSCCLLAAWSFLYRRQLHLREWAPIAASLSSILLAILLAPYQYYYVMFIAFSMPVGLLICSSKEGRLATPALALLLFTILFNSPTLGASLIMRVEQRPSFLNAQNQPVLLKAQMASPSSVVVLIGDFYDLFKPEFRRMVSLDYVGQDVNRFSDVGGIANCYDSFHGQFADIRPLPPQLNASEFHLIESSPEHLWITLFGHKVMRGQWGYGCDLYVRNDPPSLRTFASGARKRTRAQDDRVFEGGLSVTNHEY